LKFIHHVWRWREFAEVEMKRWKLHRNWYIFSRFTKREKTSTWLATWILKNVQISSSVWYQFWIEKKYFDTKNFFPLIFYEVQESTIMLLVWWRCVHTTTQKKSIYIALLLLFIHSRLILNPIQVKLFRLKKWVELSSGKIALVLLLQLYRFIRVPSTWRLCCFFLSDIHEIQRLFSIENVIECLVICASRWNCFSLIVVEFKWSEIQKSEWENECKFFRHWRWRFCSLWKMLPFAVRFSFILFTNNFWNVECKM
jgi:hypothetical protein